MSNGTEALTVKGTVTDFGYPNGNRHGKEPYAMRDRDRIDRLEQEVNLLKTYVHSLVNNNKRLIEIHLGEEKRKLDTKIIEYALVIDELEGRRPPVNLGINPDAVASNQVHINGNIEHG